MRFLFFLFSWFFLSTQAAIPQMKVLVAKGLQEFFIGGHDIQKSLAENFSVKKERQFSGARNLRFTCQKPENQAQGLHVGLNSPTGFLDFNHRRFRGSFEIHPSPKRRGCHLVQSLTLENYLSALLAKEMKKDWPLEALKAQAVAARTYAMVHMKRKKKIGNFWYLENSEKHQVHGHFFQEGPQTSKAARSTQGEILLNQKGELSPIFFHSKCGGKTLLPQMVWQRSVEGYRQVKCPFCHKHGTKDWQRELTVERFLKVALKELKQERNEALDPVQSDFILGIDNSNFSDLKFYYDRQIFKIKKSQLRAALKRKFFPSPRFQVIQKRDKLMIAGSGFGHGVGLCQYGAKEMAQKNKSYKEILAHYFPGFHLEKAY